MRAVVFDKELLYTTDYPDPVRSNGESLISVLFSGICNTDKEIVKGYMGYKGILGHEFVGTVMESDRPELIGRRVAGEINAACGNCACCKAGMGTHCPNRTVLGILERDGVFADYTCLPDTNLHLLPDNISNQEAVFIEPLAAAFRILEAVDFKPDMELLVLGDGKLGLLVAQVLKLTGCHVLVAGRHREKLQMAKNCAIATIMAEELKKTDDKFDLVVDATGSATGFAIAVDKVKPRGWLVLKTTVAGKPEVDTTRLVIDEITVVGSRCGPFEPAIQALSKKSVNVEPLISSVGGLEDVANLLNAGIKQDVIKVLVDMSLGK